MKEKIGRYEIIQFLGEGGAGKVYKAWDPAVQRDVAIKLLTAKSESQRARFRREARLLAQMTHPHVVTVFDFGEHEDTPFIVMRYMEGGSMRDLLDSRQPEFDEIAQIMAKVAGGLDDAHSLGIVHRDIKPENILFDHRGEPYLADFGLSKIFSDSNQHNPTVDEIMGTITYMSPEQVRGQQLDYLTDIYSMGVMLYEACNGELPFQADEPVAIAFKQAYEDPPPMENVSKPVQKVILKAMEKKSIDRYRSAGEMVSEFERALSAPAGRTGSLGVPEGVRGGGWLWPILAGVGVLAVLVIAGLFLTDAGRSLLGGGAPPEPTVVVDGSSSVNFEQDSVAASGDITPTSTVAAPPSDAPTSTIASVAEATPIAMVDTSTATFTPTAIMTEAPTETATPEPSATLPGPLFIVSEEGAPLYQSPNPELSDVLLNLDVGETLQIIAASADREWLFVNHPGGDIGWVQSESGDIEGVVLTEIELAGSEPTPTETATPSETPTSTSTPTTAPATPTLVVATQVPVPVATACHPDDPDCDGVLHNPSNNQYDLCQDAPGSPGTCGCPADRVPSACSGGGGGGSEPPP